MLLYHGTDARYLPRILRQGLRPRGSRPGNFQHTVASNTKAVYMTDAYALYFAFVAAKNMQWMVLEIDSDKLDQCLLLPDEDFLEQYGRANGADAPLKIYSIAKRTAWYRNHITRWMDGKSWKSSLVHLGTCQYLDTVQPGALTRAAIIDGQQNLHMRFVVDPFINTVNYALMADTYRRINAKLFGDDCAPPPNSPSLFGNRSFFECKNIRLLTLANGAVTGERTFSHDDRYLASGTEEGRLAFLEG